MTIIYYRIISIHGGNFSRAPTKKRNMWRFLNLPLKKTEYAMTFMSSPLFKKNWWIYFFKSLFDYIWRQYLFCHKYITTNLWFTCSDSCIILLLFTRQQLNRFYAISKALFIMVFKSSPLQTSQSLPMPTLTEQVVRMIINPPLLPCVLRT
jgi:hypothetical protein